MSAMPISDARGDVARSPTSLGSRAWSISVRFEVAAVARLMFLARASAVGELVTVPGADEGDDRPPTIAPVEAPDACESSEKLESLRRCAEDSAAGFEGKVLRSSASSSRCGARRLLGSGDGARRLVLWSGSMWKLLSMFIR